jgi:hypothetical protein
MGLDFTMVLDRVYLSEYCWSNSKWLFVGRKCQDKENKWMPEFVYGYQYVISEYYNDNYINQFW